MTTTIGAMPTLLDADAIARLPREPFGTVDGVMNTVLWRDESSMAGVLRVAGGHHLGEHAHHANHHHIWVLEGRAVIAGTELGAGGYAHIPTGVVHDIDATTTEGCTVFYLYIRYG